MRASNLHTILSKVGISTRPDRHHNSEAVQDKTAITMRN